MILESYVAGMAILLVAIFLNALAQKHGITTWYSHSKHISTQGFKNANTQTTKTSLLWLYVTYPFLLGITSYLILKILF
ncbi:MAG: hypothetical protein ACMXYD_00750 [Candidatus Woesearchaeota archaeon]